jgi:succinate-acetate transporter protein
MKSKLKELLLYSLACVGIIALLLSVYQPQESHGTPESHVWKMTNIYGGASTSITYMWNAETGESYRIRGTVKTKVK